MKVLLVNAHPSNPTGHKQFLDFRFIVQKSFLVLYLLNRAKSLILKLSILLEIINPLWNSCMKSRVPTSIRLLLRMYDH